MHFLEAVRLAEAVGIRQALIKENKYSIAEMIRRTERFIHGSNEARLKRKICEIKNLKSVPDNYWGVTLQSVIYAINDPLIIPISLECRLKVAGDSQSGWVFYLKARRYLQSEYLAPPSSRCNYFSKECMMCGYSTGCSKRILKMRKYSITPEKEFELHKNYELLKLISV